MTGTERAREASTSSDAVSGHVAVSGPELPSPALRSPALRSPALGGRTASRRARKGGGVAVLLGALAAGVAAVPACQTGLDGGTDAMNPNAQVPGFNSNGMLPGNPNNPLNPNNPANPGGPEDRNPSLTPIDSNGPTTDETGAPLPVEELAPLDQCPTPGPRQVRRLTSEQYRNTLVAIFDGRQDVPDAPVLRDPTTLGYNVDADDSVVEGLDASALMTLSEDIAEWAVENMLGQLSNNCTNNDQNCQRQLIQNLGRRISREPMNDQERVNRFLALFQGAQSFQDGAFNVIAAMVQSPYLLYRRELGPLDRNQPEYQLTPFEVASELSYFLNNGPPDNELLQAAEQNRLNTAVDIDTQAARLLAKPEAQAVFGRFARAWTDIDRLREKAKTGAEFPIELRDAMLEETNRLFWEVLNNGTIGELFSASYTFLNQSLSNFYGIQGAAGTGFERVDISDGRRVPGLLGHGSYLAAHALADNSSPVQRAFVVRERFLCNDLPEVPTNLDTNLKPQNPTDTSRERYARHSAEEPCNTCHTLMDPIGFSFEHYDGFGRYRDTEAGKPVDATGGVPVMDGTALADPPVTFPLDGVEDLAAYLSEIEEARACMINNLSYFGYGVANEDKWASADKVCTDNFIRMEARNNGNTLKSALMATLHAPHFTRRVLDN